jgi:hypothetical protein
MAAVDTDGPALPLEPRKIFLRPTATAIASHTIRPEKCVRVEPADNRNLTSADRCLH